MLADEDGSNLSVGQAGKQQEHGIEEPDFWAQSGRSGLFRGVGIPVTH